MSGEDSTSHAKEHEQRLKAVLDFAAECDFEEGHTLQVTKLALDIFDQLQEPLGMDDEDLPLQSMTDLAQLEGKATGLVTNSFIYDATPMAFAVHEADRGSFPSIVEQLIARERSRYEFCNHCFALISVGSAHRCWHRPARCLHRSQ